MGNMRGLEGGGSKVASPRPPRVGVGDGDGVRERERDGAEHLERMVRVESASLSSQASVFYAGHLYASACYIVCLLSVLMVRVGVVVFSSTEGWGALIADVVCLGVGVYLARAMALGSPENPYPVFTCSALSVCLLATSLLVDSPSRSAMHLLPEQSVTLGLLIYFVASGGPVRGDPRRTCLTLWCYTVAMATALVQLWLSRWALCTYLALSPLIVIEFAMSHVGRRVRDTDEGAQVVKSNRAVQAALGVFFASLPKGTRRFASVSSSSTGSRSSVGAHVSPSTPPKTTKGRERDGETGKVGETGRVGEGESIWDAEVEESMTESVDTPGTPVKGFRWRERGRESMEQLPGSVSGSLATIGERERGKEGTTSSPGRERERRMVRDTPYSPSGMYIASGVSRLAMSIGSGTLIPDSSSMGMSGYDSHSSGMIETKHDCVIAFIGVACTDRVPAVTYIRDLIILMRVLDTLIANPGVDVQKIKSTDGSVILTIMEDNNEGVERTLASDCRQMCSFCLAATRIVKHIRARGVPLLSLSGVKAGICCGSVTGGVLGTHELMYDVFGDTVNTAARLMHAASLWDVSMCLI
ncbi:hypothetical protein KIPB_005714 [Kipferlia bialata]|uniref:adenylate cyclase n=1 Tax=Kipferlia bialata TaxID=797122 RepID=A0A9K3CVU5_9EUKA|nr:hypothetical protein KIPB_005714 [Kipferlia bialata]|eukprot:g5714.t1